MVPDIRSPKCPGCGYPPAPGTDSFPTAYCPNAACYVHTWNMLQRPIDQKPPAAVRRPAT